MMILENSVTANPLRESVFPAPQTRRTTGRAWEGAVVGLAEKTSEPEPTPERATLAEINQTLKMASIGLQFEFFDQESGTMIAKVVDEKSGEVIRQMPFEEVVRISKALGKLQGLVLHQTILKKWRESLGVNCKAFW